MFTFWLIRPYFESNIWFPNNVIAFSFSVWAIEKWTHTKLWQIVLIYIGLMIYDVAFVFGSDVMMTVALGFESPMKILLPTDGGMAMLGIGDIIIPGLLVSFCMRIDFVRSMVAKSKL